MSEYFFTSLCFILLLCISGTQGRTSQKQTIYQGNYCDLLCKGTAHTLCAVGNDQLLKCTRENNVVYQVDSFHSVDMKKLLIMGHNGLRDRIAQRMKVSTMVELAWNTELEDMASAYLRSCRPFQDDMCTHYDVVVPFTELYDYFMSDKDAYKFVAQNRFCVTANYFPVNFIEMTMRAWYFDKSKLQAPRFLYNRLAMSRVGRLQGENNFTHLAYPLTTHFGCAIAKHHQNIFCIVCNYHPYHHCPNNTLQFETGEPATNCPAYFPLRNEYFKGLCTGGHADQMNMFL